MAGCSSTGAADCGELASRMWMQAAGKRGAHVTPLPPSWVTAHSMQLAVALIPWSARDFMGGVKDAVVSLYFHKSLADWVTCFAVEKSL